MAVSSSPELFLVAVSVVAREAAGSVIGAGRCAIGGKHNGDEGGDRDDPVHGDVSPRTSARIVPSAASVSLMLSSVWIAPSIGSDGHLLNGAVVAADSGDCRRQEG